MRDPAYRFERFPPYGEDEWYDNVDEIKKNMNEFLNNYKFIVCNGYMYETNTIVSVGEGLRGPRLEFKNNEYEWWYNIDGGYKLVE